MLKFPSVVKIGSVISSEIIKQFPDPISGNIIFDLEMFFIASDFSNFDPKIFIEPGHNRWSGKFRFRDPVAEHIFSTSDRLT